MSDDLSNVPVVKIGILISGILASIFLSACALPITSEYMNPPAYDT